MYDIRQLYSDAIAELRVREKERNEIRATLSTLAASLQKAAHEAGVAIKPGDSTLELIPKLIEAVRASGRVIIEPLTPSATDLLMQRAAARTTPKKKASAGDK